MREMARERGLTLAEFQAENNPAHDDAVDEKLRQLGTAENDLVIDSRLAFHWIPDAFKVYLELNLDTAAKRIYTYQTEKRREMGEVMESFEAFHESLKTRFMWEQQNYEKLYGVDPTDPRHYDLVVDTSINNPEEVARSIVETYQTWLTKA